jgi:hypothetical protein
VGGRPHHLTAAEEAAAAATERERERISPRRDAREDEALEDL